MQTSYTQEPPPRSREPSIRRAKPHEVQALAEISAATFVETFGANYPPQDLAEFLAEAYDLVTTARLLADPAMAAWLVEADGAVVGYAVAGPCALPHLEVTPACGELKRIYLLNAWRNGGLGTRLFHTAMTWLTARGPRDVWLGVWSQNQGAQRFYARFGFEKVGEYGFRVGSVIDREFVLRRTAQNFSA